MADAETATVPADEIARLRKHFDRQEIEDCLACIARGAGARSASGDRRAEASVQRFARSGGSILLEALEALTSRAWPWRLVGHS